MVTLSPLDAGSPGPFKYINVWTYHADCWGIVMEVWSRRIVECPMYILAQKLKMLKVELKVWNRQVFGNFHARVKATATKV